ncbi:MAG: FG-GAP-like repeat-containing protein [Bacteroidota bacterium]
MNPGFSFSGPSGTFLGYIDESVSDVAIDNGINNGSNFSPVLNKALPVGAIGGSHSISPSGAVSYEIPIPLPPGTHNMAPSISLVYNSQSGNGIAGYGWDISGLSSINRQGKTNYYDHKNKSYPITWTYNDRFALDGKRLLLKESDNDNYGLTQTVYVTESDPFTVITAMGSFGQAPSWFKVVNKDGLEMEYGNTADNTNAKFLTEDGNSVISWRINKIKDVNGNYILFKYINNDRDSRIDEILYTGNTSAGLAPYNKIKFYYDFREDNSSRYGLATEIKSKYILRKIAITGENGALFKEFELKQGYDDQYTYLNEIIEYGTGRGRLNSTYFRYGDNANLFETSQTNILANNDYTDFFTGDFNGDGLSDICAAEFSYLSGTDIKVHSNGVIWLRNVYGTFYGPGQTLSFPSSTSIVGTDKITNSNQFQCADFNGDGVDDILVQTLGLNAYGNRTIVKVSLYAMYNGGVTSTIQDYATPAFEQLVRNVIDDPKPGVLIGDFNGDGGCDFTIIARADDYDDYHAITPGYQMFVYYPLLGTSYDRVRFHTMPNADMFGWADQLRVLDFDGDGAHEIMVVNDNESHVWSMPTRDGLLVGSAWTTDYYANLLYNGGYPTSNHSIFIGDFNGDGKSDLLTQAWANSSSLNVGYSTGNGFTEVTHQFNVPVSLPASLGSSGDLLTIGDFNGDGLSDVLHCPATTTSYKKMYVYYSLGKKDVNTFRVNVHDYTPSLNFYQPLVPADLNGDGRTDLLHYTNYWSPINIFQFNRDGTERLLNKVVTGTSNAVEFEYRKMTEGGTFYTKGAQTAYPLINVQFPMMLVSKVKYANGIGGFNDVEYSYKEARLHKNGKGFLGFKVFSEKNLATVKTESEYEINTTYYEPLLKKQTTTLSSNNSAIKQVDYTYNLRRFDPYIVYAPYSRVHLVELTQNVTTDNLSGTVSTQSNTYDGEGNITLSTNGISGVHTQSVSTTYEAYVTGIKNRPVSVTTTQTRNGQSAYAVTTKYTYDALGRPFTEVNYFGDPKASQTTLAYDVFGNAKSKAISFSEYFTAGFTELTPFDSKGRFKVSISNPLGQLTTFTYNPLFGKVITETGVDGLVITNEYDQFGALIKQTSPTGIVTSVANGWANTGDLSQDPVNLSPFGSYWVNTMKSGAPSVKTYYDLLGRQIRSESDGLNGKVYSLKTYNSKGLLDIESSPYVKVSDSYTNVILTSHTYDEYSRVTNTQQNTLPVASSVLNTWYSYAYDAINNKVAITMPDGKTVTKTTDPTGKTISVVDGGGTLTYTYYSHGKAKEVLLNGVSTAQMEYDVRLYQTKLNDKDAGIVLYANDSRGNVVSQTDAKSTTLNFEYNGLNQLTKKTAPWATFLYTYVASGNGKNQLSTVSATGHPDFSSQTEQYTYDGFGRQLSVNKSGHVSSYFYDTYGHIVEETYPNPSKVVTIQKEYNSRGYLTKVKRGSDGATLWVNANGQFTAYTYGNGKQVVSEYDNFGYLTRTYTNGVQDLRFWFDEGDGNLVGRRDQTRSLMEKDKYDDIDRLTQSLITNQPTLDLSYNTNGNILQKTDVGAYSYHTTKPDAVKEVTNPFGVVSLNQQDILWKPFNKIYRITEGANIGFFTYDLHEDRATMEVFDNGNRKYKREYHGAYEKTIGGAAYGSNTYDVYYVNGGAGLCAIMVETNGGAAVTYYVHTDHLGSVLKLTDENGNVVMEQSYDAWGRQRNPDDWSYTGITDPPVWLSMGYTQQEHIYEFGLINMNARLYDPLLGMMLSPDNMIQAPGVTQNYNRYAYVSNNPLKYTDPTGNFLAVPFMAMAFTADFISNVKNGYSNPAGLAFSNASNAYNGINNAFQYPIYQSRGTNMSVGLSPFSMGVSANISFTYGDVSIGGGVGVGVMSGPYANGGGAYHPTIMGNKLNIGLGAGVGPNHHALGGSLTVNGYGAGYHQTKYGNAMGPDGQPNPQTIGGATIFWAGGSFRLENDFLVFKGEDRWRSDGFELTIGKFSFGNTIYNNDPETEGLGNYTDVNDPRAQNGFHQPNRPSEEGYTAWINGQTYSAYFWGGYNFGGHIERFGFATPFAQDITQNQVHRLASFGRQNYYNKYDYFNYTPYIYGGYNNPYSLWGK